MLAMDVARDDQELLVVTENGYGKRTPIDEYRKTKPRRQGRQDDQAHRARRARSPARSSCASTRSSSSSRQTGMVQRTGVRGISRYGRAAQGVRVMNIARRRPRLAPSRSWSSPSRRDATARARGPDRARDGHGDARSRPSADGPDEAVRRRAGRRPTSAGDGRRLTGEARPQTRPAARSATLADQRKEVVRIVVDSFCGTLEVTGR